MIGILFAGALVCAHAQWLNHPDPRTPRTKDGKPNLTAPAPRLNGHPDLSGLWQAERTPEAEYTSHFGPERIDLWKDGRRPSALMCRCRFPERRLAM